MLIEAQALKRRVDQHWPGNVREQRNAVRAPLVLCDGGLRRLSDLPDEIRQARLLPPPAAARETFDRDGPLLEKAEREALVRAIDLKMCHDILLSRLDSVPRR